MFLNASQVAQKAYEAAKTQAQEDEGKKQVKRTLWHQTLMDTAFCTSSWSR
ncbi:hypothetical protein BOX15_Mlig032315g2 [Macrostomum lignano]|uniref:Uncharacterized protein n=1 Tax=Macrostomum lignano TaxID=282301 RepID=A0A267EL08_9PLAT|nr:hypothetical protein BOX15_Mlig032315g2 [Macrostomum lignano]